MNGTLASQLGIKKTVFFFTGQTWVGSLGGRMGQAFTLTRGCAVPRNLLLMLSNVAAKI